MQDSAYLRQVPKYLSRIQSLADNLDLQVKIVHSPCSRFSRPKGSPLRTIYIVGTQPHPVRTRESTKDQQTNQKKTWTEVSDVDARGEARTLNLEIISHKLIVLKVSRADQLCHY